MWNYCRNHLVSLVSLVGICLVSCFALQAQSKQTFNFQKLSKKEGLSQSSVFAITQDVDGFLWFGTRDGLNRYDGYNLKVFRRKADGSGIAGNDVRSLYSDPANGNVWIGTLEGLSHYIRKENRFENFVHLSTDDKSLKSNHISSLLRDNQGNLWIATSAGLQRFLEDKRSFESIPNGVGKKSNNISVLFVDSHGVFWVGTANGLFTLDPRTNVFNDANYIANTRGLKITVIYEDRTGNLWFGSEREGLIVWNRKTETVSRFVNVSGKNNSLSHNDIRAVCEDRLGQIWIGTRQGLNLYREKSKDFEHFQRAIDSHAGLSDSSIKSLFRDTKGGLWIGTYYGGINFLDQSNRQFTNIVYDPRQGGLKSPIVSCFAEDEERNLYVGTEGGGLSFYDKSRNVFKNFTSNKVRGNTVAGDNVKQLFLDEENLWIGYFKGGLDRYNTETGVFTNFNLAEGLNSSSIYGIHKEDDWLWLASFGGGLNLLNIETNEVKTYLADEMNENAISSDFARVIYKTKNKRLWLGTSSGLNHIIIDEEGFPKRFDKFLENKKIYAIQEDRNENLWIGTLSNGLYKIDQSTNDLRHYSTEEGLSGNSVYGILQDAQGYLWLSTNSGISRFDIEEEQFLTFNNADGIENEEFNFNAYYTLADGTFLFGGTNGYTSFDPSQIKTNDYIPNVVFTDITQNNTTIQLERNINEIDEVSFEHNKANFSINFAALDYSNPKTNHYSYKLEGIDENWNYSIGKPSATYTLQRPGKYLFRLKGGNSSGIWNENERNLVIRILPPFWRSWWAYLTYSLLLLASLYSIYRYQHLRNSYLLELKEKEQKEELHRLKLNFFTNVAHEFRTPLTLIIGPLENLIKNLSNSSSKAIKSKLEKINDNAQRMLNLVNQLMTFRRMEAGHVKMKVSEVDVKDFLERTYLLFKDHADLQGIDYDFVANSSSTPIWMDVDKIEKVLFNLLSNAFKFTPSGGRIELEFRESKDSVKIFVRDSGVGIAEEDQDEIFQRFYEKNHEKSNNLIKGTGIGLALSRQLVELHSGKIEVTSRKGHGAEFLVTLLKGKDHFASVDFVPKGDVQQEQLTLDIVPSQKRPKKKVSSLTGLKILIVDDNSEIVEYLSSIFLERYRIIQASNGQEALQMSKDFQPDLVLSDVMMPVMNGLELCKALKNDEDTSHIPVILLTAKSRIDDKIEGLAAGASDFISKPFHTEELLLKIENILEGFSKVKKNKIGTDFEPSEVETVSADEEFLRNLVALVDKNIDNPDFRIEQFAHELAVSRALLFTKIKTLTDSTPKNFLKSFRMKRAINLLESGKLSVSEVAYKVGYKDPKYFSKVFQKEFGRNPSDYIEAFKV